MMHNQPEFIVKEIVEGGGRLHVIGRCGDRPIYVDPVRLYLLATSRENLLSRPGGLRFE